MFLIFLLGCFLFFVCCCCCCCCFVHLVVFHLSDHTTHFAPHLFQAPDYELHLKADQRVPNLNTVRQLDAIKERVLENLRYLKGAPCVQMTEVPPDHILYDEALKIATETSQSQGRETQRQGGESASGGNNENGMSHRRHPAEFYAGRTDQDGGGRGNHHTVGNGNNGNGSNGGGGGGGGNGNVTGGGGNVTAVKVEQEVDVVMKTEPADNATSVVVVGNDANAGRVEGEANKVEEVKLEPVKVETVAETVVETVVETVAET